MQSIDSVPTSNQSMAEFQRALSIFAHMVAARRIWLERFGELPAVSKSMFSEQANWQDCKARWNEVAQLWLNYLNRIDNAKLGDSFQYKSLDAGYFSNTIEEVLTQLFGHGWYHRGQIAMLVRAAGGQPAVTDYIYLCRRPVDVA